jgi:hypothetical protein
MFSTVIGYTLVLFVIISMVLGMCGIWGVIKGEVASKLFATSLVMCLGIVGCAYSVKVFIQELPPHAEEDHKY